MITFENCPVFWKSIFQTVTFLSTIGDEFISLAHSCHELFLSVNMAKDLSGEVVMNILDTTMNVYIHEDNSGKLVFGGYPSTKI